MNEDLLSRYDKELHRAIHKSMLEADPGQLLDNPRLTIVPKVEKRIGEIKGDVADIGCGSGYLSIWLALNNEAIKSIDAVEASQEAIDGPLQRNLRYFDVQEKVVPVLGSFDDLDREKYDFIFAMGSLHHSKDLQRTLHSISQGLKAGGYLIAQEPAMPDTTTHRQFHRKYNIVEERFGLKIRNGDRYDRFFRECEYKAAIVKSGLDIILWEDFSRKRPLLAALTAAGNSRGTEGARRLVRSLSSKVRGAVTERDSEPGEWRTQLRLATKSVKRKLIVAQKSGLEEIYHDPRQ